MYFFLPVSVIGRMLESGTEFVVGDAQSLIHNLCHNCPSNDSVRLARIGPKKLVVVIDPALHLASIPSLEYLSRKRRTPRAITLVPSGMETVKCLAGLNQPLISLYIAQLPGGDRQALLRTRHNLWHLRKVGGTQRMVLTELGVNLEEDD